MYDRQRDLTVSFNNDNKHYFGSPRYEIYVFFDNQSGFWHYEILDNNSFSLVEFNSKGGRLVKTNVVWCEPWMFIEILKQRYVDSVIEAYECMYDWIQDKESGCWR